MKRLLLIFFYIPTFAAIYGVDNRVDVYQHPNPQVRTMAQSTAAIVAKSFLKSDSPDSFLPVYASLKEDINLCEWEKDSLTPTLAQCSAFLVDHEWLVTAAHCVNPNSCLQLNFVFDFQVDSSNKAPEKFYSKNVYGCDNIYIPTNSSVEHYALIHLSRPVIDRNPLPLSDRTLEDGQSVFVIGNPLGLPTRIASHGTIRSQTPRHYVADTDTFGVNSGSAVFTKITDNTKSDERYAIIGILIAGEEDFDFQPEKYGYCQFIKTCEQNSCRGEDILKSSFIVEGLKRAKAQRAP